jgi:hypothetical protein
VSALLAMLGSGNAGAALAPSLTGLAAWYKAESIGVGDGNPVSQWNDSSGNANHITQATAGKKPTYIAASTINSLPAVRFDNTNDKVLLLAAPTGFGAATGVTICLAVRITTDTASGCMVSVDPATTMELYVTNSAGNTRYNWQVSRVVNPGVGAAPLAPRVVLATFDDSSNADTLEVVGVGTSSLSDVQTLAISQISLGARTNVEATTFEGDIAEVLIYDRDITGAGLTQTKAYLQGKFGL